MKMTLCWFIWNLSGQFFSQLFCKSVWLEIQPSRGASKHLLSDSSGKSSVSKDTVKQSFDNVGSRLFLRLADRAAHHIRRPDVIVAILSANCFRFRPRLNDSENVDGYWKFGKTLSTRGVIKPVWRIGFIAQFFTCWSRFENIKHVSSLTTLSTQCIDIKKSF